MRRPCPFPSVDRCKRFSASKRATVDDADRRSRAWVARCGVTVISRYRIHQEEMCITGFSKTHATLPHGLYRQFLECFSSGKTMIPADLCHALAYPLFPTLHLVQLRVMLAQRRNLQVYII